MLSSTDLLLVTSEVEVGANQDLFANAETESWRVLQQNASAVVICE